MQYFIAVGLTFGSLIVTAESPLHGETLIYTIEEGDTLESIVERFKVSVSALIKINRFHNLEQAQKNIVRGESILIPESDIVFASVGEQGIETEPSKPQIELSIELASAPPKQPSAPDTAVNPLINPSVNPSAPSSKNKIQTQNQKNKIQWRIKTLESINNIVNIKLKRGTLSRFWPFVLT